MSDNQQFLLESLRLYVKMNIEGCDDKEYRRILMNVMEYVIQIEDDE